MPVIRRGLLMLSLMLPLAACSIPKIGMPQVHKVTVQQGNVITQEMIDQLKPGMTRSQVAYIMGEPVFRNPFNDDRWDYVYTLEIPGLYEQQRHASLYFENDVLAYFTGDFAPTDAAKTAGSDSPDDAPAVPVTPDIEGAVDAEADALLEDS